MTLRRRARYTGPSDLTRSALLTRSGGLCEVCGISAPCDPHHRRPRGMGGTSDPDTNRLSNLIAACRACHDELESMRLRSIAGGLLVTQADDRDTTEIPVRLVKTLGGRRQAIVVLLDDEGDWEVVAA